MSAMLGGISGSPPTNAAANSSCHVCLGIVALAWAVSGNGALLNQSRYLAHRNFPSGPCPKTWFGLATALLSVHCKTTTDYYFNLH